MCYRILCLAADHTGVDSAWPALPTAAHLRPACSEPLCYGGTGCTGCFGKTYTLFDVVIYSTINMITASPINTMIKGHVWEECYFTRATHITCSTSPFTSETHTTMSMTLQCHYLYYLASDNPVMVSLYTLVVLHWILTLDFGDEGGSCLCCVSRYMCSITSILDDRPIVFAYFIIFSWYSRGFVKRNAVLQYLSQFPWPAWIFPCGKRKMWVVFLSFSGL